MKVQGVKSRGSIVSARRIVAMAVTIGCHLCLLLVLLRPGIPSTDIPSVVEADIRVLKLRFILPPRPTSAPLVPPARHLGVVSLSIPRKEPMKEAIPPLSQLAAHVIPQPASTNASSPSGGLALPNVLVSPNQYTNSQVSAEDGGFRERLLKAQHSDDIHGIPGSDRPIVRGIQFINPMNQGIGAVARKMQRLFGITNHHCIDVEVWKSLTPEELIVRHVSPDDVKEQAEKYNCYHPSGLNF